MRPVNPLEMAALDINALSQEERTIVYREAKRRAHVMRSDAVRELFRAAASCFERQPLLTRALVDSAAVLAVVIALGAMISEPVSARMASVSVTSDYSVEGKPRVTAYGQAKKAIYCNGIIGAEFRHRGC